jgi:putative membrane protein
MRGSVLLAATASLLAAAPGLAQTQQQRALGTQSQTGSPPPTDPAAPAAGLGSAATRGDALAAARTTAGATSDLYEMEASRLAEQRAQNPEVKRFAERMLRDHGKTTGELKGMLPQLQGVSAQQMATSLDRQHQALLEQLQGAQGAEFDGAFARQQVQSHQAAVDLFRAYAQSGDDARLEQWASQTLPSLEEHLREAQQLLRATQG